MLGTAMPLLRMTDPKLENFGTSCSINDKGLVANGPTFIRNPEKKKKRLPCRHVDKASTLGTRETPRKAFHS
jgi:hypothetical protein